MVFQQNAPVFIAKNSEEPFLLDSMQKRMKWKWYRYQCLCSFCLFVNSFIRLLCNCSAFRSRVLLNDSRRIYAKNSWPFAIAKLEFYFNDPMKKVLQTFANWFFPQTHWLITGAFGTEITSYDLQHHSNIPYSPSMNSKRDALKLLLMKIPFQSVNISVL